MAEPEVVICYDETCTDISILASKSWSLEPDRSGRVACENSSTYHRIARTADPSTSRSESGASSARR